MNKGEFAEARDRAVKHLGRFYNIREIDLPKETTDHISCYELELEILKEGNTLCLVINIILEPDFPLSLPTIYLPKEGIDELGFLPNIDTKGQICTFDRNTNIPNPNAPEYVLEVCVTRAKNIIEEGLRGNNLDKFNNEFIAYWENTYEPEENIDWKVLSLIGENDKSIDSIKYVDFQPSIGMFGKLIYSEKEQFDKFKLYFERHKFKYRETPTFYIGQINISSPPYHLNNEGVLNLMKTLGLENKFIEYLNSRPSLPIVTFSKVIDSRMVCFGWCHKPVQIKTHRRRGKFIQLEKKIKPERYYKLLDENNSSVYVRRFSPQIFDHNRLTNRASADYDKHEGRNSTKVMIAGLGSVGSNLIPFLEKSDVTEFRLVDDDILSLDNIGRHYLGISDTGKKKTQALRDYIETKNPLTTVHTREKNIVPLVQEEPTFLSACDFYFFCTGDINSEAWLANNILKSSWNRPSFFIWVEPYLAGGHCLYFNGVDPIFWDKIFPNNRFIYNVISDETHQQTNFVRREAGCQVTFLPYSAANLQLFIAALFPKILKIFKESSKNKCFSWVGDLSTLREMRIGLSRNADGIESFSIVERQL